MSKITVQDLLNWINNEEWDLIEMAGGYDVVLSILERKNALHKLDFESNAIDNDLNIILYKLVTSGNKEVVKETYDRIKREIFSNRTLIEKDGRWFMVMEEMSDLSMFFCSRGRHNDQDIVSTVLKGEGWTPFDDPTNNIYDDVISELNSENKSILKEKVRENIIGKTIPTNTDLLEMICGDECDGEITVTNDNYDQIFEDEETLVFILDQYLHEIKSDLSNLHWNAYNNAYESEVYDRIWGELEDYIDKDGSDWVSYNSVTNPDKKFYYYHADVTNTINNLIFEFLDSNKGYGGPHRISYFGSLESIIENMIDDGTLECLSFRDPEYPDHRLVSKNLNDNFDL